MCRLFACIPTHFKKQGDILDILLDQEGQRTGDGFGFGLVSDGKFVVKKTVFSLSELLKKKDNKEYKDFFKGVFNHDSWVIFHSRKISVGHACQKNSHPFISDEYCGMHNGTMKSYELLEAIMGKEIKCHSDTDSELGIKIIEKLGIKKASKLLDDSGVFILLDKDSNLIVLKSEYSDDLKIVSLSKKKTFLISTLPHIDMEYKDEKEAEEGFYIYNKNGMLINFKKKPTGWADKQFKKTDYSQEIYGTEYYKRMNEGRYDTELDRIRKNYIVKNGNIQEVLKHKPIGAPLVGGGPARSLSIHEAADLTGEEWIKNFRS